MKAKLDQTLRAPRVIGPVQTPSSESCSPEVGTSNSNKGVIHKVQLANSVTIVTIYRYSDPKSPNGVNRRCVSPGVGFRVCEI